MTDATTPTVGRRFLEIEYVARTENGRIIDTTDPEMATSSDIADLDASGPVVVVPGEGHMFDSLEEAIRDADPGATLDVTVPPEQAFGTPTPGDVVTLDEAAIAAEQREVGKTVQLGGRRAVVEESGDGTVTVDFSHPLAGVTLEYELEVLEALSGLEERAAGLLTTHGLRDASVTYDGDTETLTLRYAASEPTSDRDTRKRAYIADVRRLIEIPSVTIIEEYSGDDD